MTVMTKKTLQEIEDYYSRGSYKKCSPFPEELKLKLLDIYGVEPAPHSWTEQDIFEGSRKIVQDYLNQK